MDTDFVLAPYINNTQLMLCVKDSTIVGAGKGLFAYEHIPKGTFIGIWEGKLQRNDGKTDIGEHSQYISDDFFISSTDFPRCFVAMINDAHNSNNVNNCELVLRDSAPNGTKIPIDKRRVELWSTMDIEPLSELFCSYGPDFWMYS